MSNHQPPPQQQGERDSTGQFKPGHAIGKATRWQPGQSGNPSGTPIGGSKPGRWIEPHGDATHDDLQTIVADPNASASAKASAKASARLWLDTADPDPNVRRNALRVLLDRAEGKPGVKLEVTGPPHHTTNPAMLESKLVALFERRPDLIGLLVEQHPAIAQRLASLLPPAATQ